MNRAIPRGLASVFHLFALPLLLVLVWAVATSGSDDFFSVTPAELVSAFRAEWLGGRIWTDLLPSIGRLFAGLAIAFVVGVVLGVLIGSLRRVRYLLEPALEFFRAVPPPVLIPVLALIMGVGDDMRVFVIAFGAIWPVLLNTVEGVRAVDSVLRDSCETYQLNGWRRLRDLTLPSAMPQIMTGMRQSLSVALILVVISEMFAASSGLGYTIIQFQRTFAIPQMWSGIALLGLLGIVLSFVFQFIESRVLRWYHGLKEVEGDA